MISIHPEFDITTGTWFWNEFEAPTIRALKRLVGPQVKIMDYYPSGFGTVIAMKMMDNEKKRAAIRVTPPTMANSGSGFHQLPSKRVATNSDRCLSNGRSFFKHDHNKILDLWYAGIQSKEIARQCGGGLTADVARSTVMLARRKGDYRAVRRTKGG